MYYLDFYLHILIKERVSKFDWVLFLCHSAYLISIIYRRLLLCRLHVSQYCHLCWSDFFIPNIFSPYIFAFQLHLCRKRLTWSNRYLDVIFHALDVFSIASATAYVQVKNQRSQGCCIVCFGYVYALPEVRKSSRQWSKTIRVKELL